jgi:deoxyribodipyrimidine photo-lyase
MGLIDASLRELIHTGYTSNRARQNVALFLAKHLHIDCRIGAEWYECMLVDYDLPSNWGNWQYFAGVGNDPRSETKIFNPVKQAFEYDPKGEYVKAWVPELRGLMEPSEIFQAWTVPDARKEELGLKGKNWVDSPLLKIDFALGRREQYLGRGGKRGGGDNRGRRGDREWSNRTRSSKCGTGRPRGQSRGRYGSSRGHLGGYGRN